MGQARGREAEAELPTAVQQDPGLAGAWMRLAGLCKAQGRLAEAAECSARGQATITGRR